MPDCHPTRAAATLFIADDHKIVRDGLRVLAERAGGFTIVGDAADGRVLVERTLALRPDIVVADLAMPELNGLEAVRQLRAQGFAGIVVMISMHRERRFLAQALDAGVNAYVHKDYAFDQILAAIEAARRGEIWLSPELAGALEDESVPTLADLLSMREREVLQLFAEGKGTKEIAAVLALSPKTVEAHRLNLFAKLRVNNVVELTRIAIREGLVQL